MLQPRALRSARLAILALTCLLWSVPAVAADKPAASTEPRTSGPLVGSQSSCEADRTPEPAPGMARFCSWSYNLLPVETNVGEDFSAYWVQIEIDPSNGMCAKEIMFQLSAPSDGRIVSGVPAVGQKVQRAKPITTQLNVDAEGAAPLPGTVAQDLSSVPGRTSIFVDEDAYSYRWRGNSRGKVLVAIGIQLAHRRLPPELVTLSFQGVGFAIGSCRPHVIWVR